MSKQKRLCYYNFSEQDIGLQWKEEAADATMRAKAKSDAATKCDLGSTLMSALIVSGVVVVAVGVAFFVTKKLKEA